MRKSLIDVRGETAPQTSNAYPMHEAYTKDPNTGAKLDRVCAGFLVLPETLGIATDGTALFCLACKRHVAPEPGQRSQAERAATAEGAKPIVRGEMTPGSLPDEARAALLYDHLLSLPRWLAVPDGQEQKRAMLKDIDRGWPVLQSIGLAEPGVARVLTAAGLDLQRRVASPEVPTDRLVTDPRFAPVYEPTSKPTPRKERPAAPMICECGHGPSAHTHGDARGLDPCRECDGACERYRNVKPPKPEKAKRKAKVAA
jgi:hypothetical protein